MSLLLRTSDLMTRSPEVRFANASKRPSDQSSQFPFVDGAVCNQVPLCRIAVEMDSQAVFLPASGNPEGESLHACR
jgi:hypothetical protein